MRVRVCGGGGGRGRVCVCVEGVVRDICILCRWYRYIASFPSRFLALPSVIKIQVCRAGNFLDTIYYIYMIVGSN